MKTSKSKEFYSVLMIVTNAFRESSDGGAFYLELMTLPDADVENNFIDTFYSIIKKNMADGKVADKIIEYLKILRNLALSDEKFSKKIKKHATRILEAKMLVDAIKN